jgi:hypothetical protein
VLAPERVGRIVLTDVPFFNAEKSAELLRDTPEKVVLDADIGMLNKAWNFCVTTKLEHIPLTRAYQTFIDHMSSGELGNSAFRAAFSYPCEERFQQVRVPATIIATKSMLHQMSCDAAKLITSAKLVELPGVTATVLEKGAPAVAKQVLNILRSSAINSSPDY